MKSKVIQLRERRRKKLSNIKARKRKRLFITSALLISLLTVAWLLYSSNFFSVKEIRVKGNKNITDQQIIEKSGIKRDASLITLPSSKISNRLRKINWVQHAAVLKDWPDTVILEIIERKPIAYIQTDGSTYLVDKKGFIIDKRVNIQAGYTLPKIDGLPIDKVRAGTYVKNKALENALEAYQSLYKELQEDIYSITANSPEELYFIANGIEIIYGKAEKTKLKNQVIRTILKQKKERISTIDIRVPDKPVVRLIGR